MRRAESEVKAPVGDEAGSGSVAALRAEARWWRWVAEWMIASRRRDPRHRDFGNAMIALADIAPYPRFDVDDLNAMYARQDAHAALWKHRNLWRLGDRSVVALAALFLALECEDEARALTTKRPSPSQGKL